MPSRRGSAYGNRPLKLRDFSSEEQTRADHYEVQVEDGYAAEAERVLSTMPAT